MGNITSTQTGVFTENAYMIQSPLNGKDVLLQKRKRFGRLRVILKVFEVIFSANVIKSDCYLEFTETVATAKFLFIFFF